MQDKLVYSVQDVLGLLPISNTALYEAISSGEMVSLKVGRRRFITAQALHAYVAQMGSPKTRKRSEVSHGC